MSPGRTAAEPDPAPVETAPAKLNLTLAVTGRRADGYHELDSLVAFTALGDRLEAAPAEAPSLTVGGAFGQDVPRGSDNLASRAVAALARAHGRAPTLALHLDKALPAAAGLGGGSADAAAALRLAARLWGVRVPPDLALTLGADVPVCLGAPAPQVMRGIGERVTPAPPLPAAWAVLVNPRVPLPTGPVFGALERTGAPGPALPAAWPDFEALRAWLAAGRNDLEAPARSLAPAVGEVLDALASAPIARMSGSGATCFALHPARPAAEAQAEALCRARPGWWVAATPLARAA